MPLTTGARLGCYDILSPLGAGGMGEVFRARDTKLQRDVALKILPELFHLDPDRLARFKREAQVLASLNHPNIAAIHGFEDSTEPKALVLELVEGVTLAERIAQGPMPLDESLPIARQICDALEAAHEQGIIHRDLKPANIKIRPDGAVKVLDFGLAKAMEPAAPDSTAATTSPTITSPALTRMGLVLGTASYMSPEQARGRTADKRSDIWAFGCVLYEMLTGRRAFEGEEVSDTLASVLKSDPDWSALPPTLPASIRALVEGSLKRDRRDRIADISTARFLLNQPLTPAPATSVAQPSRQPVWKWAAACLATGAVIGVGTVAGVRALRPAAAAPPITRFAFNLPQGQQFSLARLTLAISADGTQIVYGANGRLYLRTMSDPEPRPIPGTELTTGVAFSPDSRSLVYWSDAAIKRIPVSGGTPFTICRTGPAPSSLSWDESGILFPQQGTGIMRVSPDGGKPEVLVALTTSDSLAHGPQVLPDGDTVLFTLANAAGITNVDRWETARIVVQSLKTHKRATLIEPGTDGRYVPTGHIVYAVAGTLFARSFDLKRLAITGAPIPVVDGVRRVIAPDTGTAQFVFSSTGSLAYVPGPTAAGIQSLFLFDRSGAAETLKLPPGLYRFPRVSPDGKRLAFESTDGKEAFVSIYDMSGTSSARRLTFGGNNRYPVWAADGSHVVFQSDREGDAGVFWQPVDGGTAERLTKPDPGTSHIPESWSRAEDVLLFSVTDRSVTKLWTLPVRDRKAAPFGDVTSTLPTDAVFSPDGRWVAYQSGEPGSGEAVVFVQPFPANGIKHQIARGGRPVWSPDGSELFYIPGPGQLRVVTVVTRPTFTFTDPTAVPRGFGASGPSGQRTFDITPQGRFIAPGEPAQSSSAASDATQVRVVLNWFEDLKARAPVR